MIVVQQTAEAFAADNLAGCLADLLFGFWDLVVEALVIAFVMIMKQELFDRVSQCPDLTHGQPRNHSMRSSI